MSYTVMADTVGPSAHNIPSAIAKVAGYNTGPESIIWTEAEWAMFKNRGQVIICQHADKNEYLKADAFDIEPGAMSIADFMEAARIRQSRGWNSCAYIEASQTGALVQACRDAKLSLDKIQLWVANWNYSEAEAASFLGTVIGGCTVVAVQWASPTSNPHTLCPGSSKTLSELNLDLSVTEVAWFAAPAVQDKPPTLVSTPSPLVNATLNIHTSHGTFTVPVTSSDNGKSWDFA